MAAARGGQVSSQLVRKIALAEAALGADVAAVQQAAGITPEVLGDVEGSVSLAVVSAGRKPAW